MKRSPQSELLVRVLTPVMARLAARLIARLGAEHEAMIVEEVLRTTYDAGSTLRDIEDAAPRLQ